MQWHSSAGADPYTEGGEDGQSQPVQPHSAMFARGN